jgi:predicted hydrocarbon binding protein
MSAVQQPTHTIKVEGALGKRVSSIDVDRDRGWIGIRGIRYLLIQPRTLVGFQKAAEAAEAAGSAVAEWLQTGGRSGGRNSSQKFREVSGRAGRDFAQAYLDMGAEIGWGVFRVTRFEGREFEVEVTGSPFAEEYGQAGRPVCHFTLGVIAGLGDTLFGGAQCREVECAATGAPRCRFICRA